MDEENDDSEVLCKISMKKKTIPGIYLLSCTYFSQKFKNRSECVLESEERYWRAITVECMSEESDKSDDPGTIIVHHLTWRSNGYYYKKHTLSLIAVYYRS